MPEVVQAEVAYNDAMNIPVLVRELNQVVRLIASAVSQNYWFGYPQVDAVILSNITQIIWVPLNDYDIESITVVTSSGTASVTPRIGGVNIGVSGGVPITATTSPTKHDVTSANAVSALQSVDCVVSGLGGGQRLNVVLGVRRTD